MIKSRSKLAESPKYRRLRACVSTFVRRRPRSCFRFLQRLLSSHSESQPVFAESHSSSSTARSAASWSAYGGVSALGGVRARRGARERSVVRGEGWVVCVQRCVAVTGGVVVLRVA